MSELGRTKVIEKVTKKGLWFYRQYCENKECKYEYLGASVGEPILNYPGGIAVCPECLKKKRETVGQLKTEEYLIDARTGSEEQ